MSPRSLQRKLLAESLSFSELCASASASACCKRS